MQVKQRFSYKTLPKLYQKSLQNRSKILQNGAKIVVWRCLRTVWGGLGAQRARKPTRMHFRMRKPRSWLTLGGCFLVQFVVFFCVFFCCLFVLAPRTVFYGFLGDFELIFDSISWVFCSKVEVVFFASILSKTMIFKVPGLLFFSVFFQSFPHSIPDLIFLVFFGDFRVAKAPVLELLGLIFRHQKKAVSYTHLTLPTILRV